MSWVPAFSLSNFNYDDLSVIPIIDQYDTETDTAEVTNPIVATLDVTSFYPSQRTSTRSGG